MPPRVHRVTAGLRVRPLTRADWPAVLAINAAGHPGVTRLTEAEMPEMEALSAVWIVAEADDGPVGYLAAFPPDAPYEAAEFAWLRARYERFLYVDQVAVAEEWRGRGVGALLYRAAEAAAAARGDAHLVCEVNLRPPNPASLAFHARLGFRQVGTLELADGRRVSLQAKVLPPPRTTT